MIKQLYVWDSKGIRNYTDIEIIHLSESRGVLHIEHSKGTNHIHRGDSITVNTERRHTDWINENKHFDCAFYALLDDVTELDAAWKRAYPKPIIVKEPEPVKKSLWQRIFGCSK